LGKLAPEPIAQAREGVEEQPGKDSAARREFGVRQCRQRAGDGLLPEIFRIEVITREPVDEGPQGRLEESNHKEGGPKSPTALDASYERPPHFGLPRVDADVMEELAESDRVDETLKDGLPLANEVEPSAQGGRVKFALEFLYESQPAGRHGNDLLGRSGHPSRLAQSARG